jgi:carotenoid 1,2-hydratase
MSDLGPHFDQQIRPGGYVWWYVDAFSDDGAFGLTIIAFVGSVFSPYYAWAGRRDPEDHCAINVALYGPEKRWAMTERGREGLRRSCDSFVVGASALAWDGKGLDILIDERCAPFPTRLRGRVRLEAETLNGRAFTLETAGGHLWRPIAPLARVEAEFSSPGQKWSGHGYFDTNQGEEPLEAGFSRWTWSRARAANGARVFYEAERRREDPLAMSLRFAADGGVFEEPAPPIVNLPPSRWRVPRRTRGDGEARIAATLEDTPFYARSRVQHRLRGESVVSVHESLDLNRFAHPVIQCMLPFRMPRWRAAASVPA